MTPRLDVDRVPEFRRPPEVAALVDEARRLRDQLRAEREQLASAEAKLEQAKDADALAASERLRQGANVGAEAPVVEKSRRAVEGAKRAECAAELAAGAVAVDIASAVRAHSDRWVADLDAEQTQARDHALAALADSEQALADMRDAAAAAGWIRGATEDGRLDRPARPPLLGSLAPSSRTRTANGEPLNTGELIGYVRELVEPTPPPVVAVAEPATTTDTG